MIAFEIPRFIGLGLTKDCAIVFFFTVGRRTEEVTNSNVRQKKNHSDAQIGAITSNDQRIYFFFSQLAYLTPDIIAMHVGQSYSEAINKSTKGMYSLLDVVFSGKSQEMLTRTTWDYQALAWVHQICYALYI